MPTGLCLESYPFTTLEMAIEKINLLEYHMTECHYTIQVVKDRFNPNEGYLKYQGYVPEGMEYINVATSKEFMVVEDNDI